MGVERRVTLCAWVICRYFKRRENKEEAVKENGGKKKTLHSQFTAGRCSLS